MNARWLLALVAVAACACTTHALLIGVDVGSAYIKVALVKPGTPFEIVHNSNSRRKSEALVGFYQGQRSFAGDAVVLTTRKPHLVFRDVRALLGRNLTHPSVQHMLNTKMPAFLVEEAEGNRGSLALRAGTGKGDGDEEKPLYSVEEVMAMILTYVRTISSDVAGACLWRLWAWPSCVQCDSDVVDHLCCS